MRLSTKLVLITAILLVAFAALGFFSIIQLQKVNQKNIEITTNWLPSTINVQRMNTLTSDYRIYEISYVDSVNQDTQLEFMEAISSILQELSVVRKTYEALISFEQEQQVYDRFSALWQAYLDLSQQIFAIAQNGNTELAVSILQNESRILFDSASNELLEAVNINRREGVRVSHEGDAVYAHSLSLIYMSIVCVVLFAAFLCSWLIWSIRRQLGKDPSELIGITGRVIAGDYDIDDKKNHRGVYKHLLTMVSSLKHHIDRAEKNARIKSEFLANMSHEIRTPMNGILGLLYLLSQTKLNIKQEDYVQKTLLSANNLLRIIDDILDFSKMEAGKLELESIPFRIEGICDEISALYNPKAQERGIFLAVDAGWHTDTVLLGDPLRIKQVLFNFVSNALKFTEEGGVTVSVHCDPPHENVLRCVFSVQDTGIGLGSEQHKRLFSAFTQADSSITRKYGGTGLGLVICKKIVEAMGGSLWVESRKGHGSTFFFALTLPVCADDVELHSYDHETTLCDRAAYTGHLLLVEDNEINQIIAKELLQDVGYTVDVVENGQEALNILEKNTYVAVLMDIQMPVMDGLTAARKIRENPAYKDLVVIAMSAHAMDGDYEISLQNGMNDHITKPINPVTLYGTLDKWISGAHSV